MKLKNFLLYGLSLVLVTTVAVGGTLAYLTSNDSDVNVMTLGEVEIEQHEYERVQNADGTYPTKTIDGTTSYILKEFTQAKPLLPIVGDPNESGNSPEYAGWDDIRVRMTQVDSYGTMQVFAGKNAQDKFVTVENTGKTNAYVRTLVAFEIGSSDGSKIMSSARADKTHDGSSPWLSTSVGTVEIDGNTYAVVEYLYLGAKLSDGSWRHENGILPSGDTTYPNLSQVYLKHNATNEDMEAIDGNNNGNLDIIVLSQAVQAKGFADAKTALDTAFGASADKIAEWLGGTPAPTFVYSATELQDALDAATNGAIIILGDDITGNVTATQKPDVKLTINGNGNTFNGSITIDGKSARYATAGLTIENVNFAGVTGKDTVYINLGVSGNTNTRYTSNVTVKNCTFTSENQQTAAIKSYTGGDHNLTVKDCSVDAGMHSFLQLSNIEKGLKVEDCKVYSKNGINLNYTTNLEMSGCEIDVQGYAVRFGVGSSTNNGNFTIADSNLKSANDDGDAVIILRGTMTGATLTLKNVTLTGTPDITGTANIIK